MKYLGGKQRLGKRISPILHALWEEGNYNGYIEPFCGSLGVFQHMTTLSNAKTIVANDYHPDLIALWTDLQKGVFQPPDSVSEKQYNDAKLLQSPNSMKAFIGFGMSFGGRYFAAFAPNYLGSKKEDFCKEMTNSLNRIAPKIRLPNVKFTNLKYQSLRPKNKLIYCDPPYRVTNHPIKYRITTKEYDIFDNDEFWNIMRKWSISNVVIISETTAPDDFVEVWNNDRYRSAAQSTKTRFKSKTTKTSQNEKLFVHKKHTKMVLDIISRKKN